MNCGQHLTQKFSLEDYWDNNINNNSYLSIHQSVYLCPGPVRRASVEELQDFLSKMDSNIANSKKATIREATSSSIFMPINEIVESLLLGV